MTFDLGTIKRQRSKQHQVFGGTLVTTTNYKIHTFTSSQELVVFTPVEVDLLLVGGGGGAGESGGAGAGGVVLRTLVLPAGTYNVIIGAGGFGPNQFQEQNGNDATGGSDSSITGPAFQLVALGGGGAVGNPRQSGGSGAGSIRAAFWGSTGSYHGGTPGLGLQPTSSWPGLGNDGGLHTLGNFPRVEVWNIVSGVGGGGGAGGPGRRAWLTVYKHIPAAGGPGIASDISGTTQYYAGGGGALASDGGAAATEAEIGFNGPLDGYVPESPIPNSFNSNQLDKTFINAYTIQNIYGTDPFSALITAPYSGNYLVRWYVSGVSSFTWNVDNGANFDQTVGTVVQSIRQITIYLDAGEHNFNFNLISTYTSGRPFAKADGQIAWAIYNENGTTQYWNTRNHVILTGGPDHYGGGGGPAQSGGQGVCILRYRNI